MMITVRRLHPEETRIFLEVHHAAVRGIAAADYPSEVIEAWAPLPITDQNVERALLNPDNELRFAAVSGGEIVGIGAVVLHQRELRACYVAPGAARSGVGSAIVGELERTARAHHLTFLELDSSLAATAFYLRFGYRILERSIHRLGSGQPMACIKMRKDL